MSTVPTPLTSFIGRTTEITLARTLLEHTRLLTLTGPGGSGKTRLAIAIAKTVTDGFPDGIVFVSLASLTDSTFVPATIATALDVPDRVDRGPVDGVVAALAHRQVLLVLDNFEHVADAAQVVATILGSCPAVRILATSRVPLRLTGEQRLPIPPLTVSDDVPPVPDAALEQDAVLLFTQRAQAIQPSFIVTPDNVSAVIEVCRRLDGLPLAIELAAARIALLTPAALLGHLTARLALLTGGARDLPARQQTLRATLAWSYDLLPAEAQRVFRQLAVFAGGWTLKAAEAVCDVDTSVFDALATLVDHSLVGHIEQPDGSTRFGMLETIREFALEQLTANREDYESRCRHADYCVQLAQDAGGQFDGPDLERWIARLEADHDNLRDALTWLWERGDAERGLEILGELGRWWIDGGHLTEGWVQTGAFLALPGAAGPTASRAKALLAAGRLARWRGDYQQSIALYEEALRLWQDLGDRRRVPYLLNLLGIAVESAGDLERAQACWEQGLAVARELGDQTNMARALTNLGGVADQRGDEGQAVQLWQESHTLARAAGNTQVLALSLLDLAAVAERRGDAKRAAALYKECLSIYRDLGILWGMARVLEAIARIAVGWGHPHRAISLWAASAKMRQAPGGPISAVIGGPHDSRTAAPIPNVADVRTMLGDAAFQRAWEQGMTLSLADTIAEALAVTPIPSGECMPEVPGGLQHGLTPRETEVVRLIAAGHSNKQIAVELGISVRTVERHITNLYTKIDAYSKADATAWALRHALA